jgi:hypothetical protein
MHSRWHFFPAGVDATFTRFRQPLLPSAINDTTTAARSVRMGRGKALLPRSSTSCGARGDHV